MRDPRAVMTVSRLAAFVLAHFLQRPFIGGGIALYRDISGHAAHRKSAALMARLDTRQRVGAHERRGHGHLRAVRDDKLLSARESLNVTENIIPSPAIQPAAVMPQL